MDTWEKLKAHGPRMRKKKSNGRVSRNTRSTTESKVDPTEGGKKESKTGRETVIGKKDTPKQLIKNSGRKEKKKANTVIGRKGSSKQLIKTPGSKEEKNKTKESLVAKGGKKKKKRRKSM